MKLTMGQTIRRLRHEKNLTQEELAERLNLTAQAISKWENDVGMPDISQIVPLASVLEVSCDLLLGYNSSLPNDEVDSILNSAQSLLSGGLDDRLAAYDLIRGGLNKYPCSPKLLMRCCELGLSLSLPENPDCANERAEEIGRDVTRMAKRIIACSSDVNDQLRARQILILLYSSSGQYDLAYNEAECFPCRADFTYLSALADIAAREGDYERETAYRCTDIDYILQQLENETALLGKAYYNLARYRDAIAVYESFLNLTDAIFGDSYRPPYHDFDSGDLYLLLAEAYLATDDRENAVMSFCASLEYWLELLGGSDNISRTDRIISPLVARSELEMSFSRSMVKRRLNAKLVYPGLEAIMDDPRIGELRRRVERIDG